jgi:hypothetical protein
MSVCGKKEHRIPRSLMDNTRQDPQQPNPEEDCVLIHFSELAP